MRNLVRISNGSLGALFVAGVVMSHAAAARADEAKSVQKIRWSEEKAAGRLAAGEVVQQPGKDPAEWLVVRRAADGPDVVHILALDSPGVGPPAYVLRGRVRYEDVKETSFLEMWNYFADGSAYFSRTLGTSGPMELLKGTSGWRAFELPFMLSAPDGSQSAPPTKLELNVVLPGGGTVYLGNLELVQLGGGAAASAPWWSPRTGGMIGAIAGSAVGCLGALVGTLAGTGRARRAVMWLLVVWIAASTVSLLAGTVALTLGQPYAVYYPLLMLGLLGTVLPGGLLPTIRHRYRQHELRRMEAFDVG